MATRSKFFRIAVEGATCDGRTLDRNALQEMADTYNPATYQARVNMEHIRGFSADPPFCAYGDVVALKTEEVELQLGGKTEKKLGLFAQVDALDNLVAVQAKGQKLFSSIELNPNFAGTGKAYLQGLAVTDSPASLGTEIMQFAAAQGDKSPFAGRKIDKGNFFSAATETAIEFEAAAAPGADGGMSAFFTEARALLARFTGGKGEDAAAGAGGGQQQQAQERQPPPEAANDNEARFTAVSQAVERMAAGVEAAVTRLTGELGTVRADIAAVKASIDTTDRSPERRPLATGGRNFAQADC